MAPPPLLLLIAIVSAAAAATSPPATTTTLPSVATSPVAATALFVLGDSTASCADNSLLLPIPPHLNISLLPPCRTTPRLLPDLIAEKMGLPPPPPFDGLNGTSASVAAGVNFAGASAVGGGGGAAVAFRLEAVGQQLRLAAETMQLARLQDGPAAVAAAEAAVFVVSFGADGYARLLGRGAESDAAAPKYGRRGFGRLLAARLGRAVSELYDADVRRVVVMGVGPLGCAPRVMWEGLHVLDGHDCVEEANDVIQGYNARLVAEMDALRPRLPGAQIVFCDVYKGMMEIISNPRTYGFEDIREACCGFGPFGGMIGCLAKEMACDTPHTHLWWDLYRPTEAVNTLLANWSWSAPRSSNISICHPITLQQLAGHASLD